MKGAVARSAIGCPTRARRKRMAHDMFLLVFFFVLLL